MVKGDDATKLRRRFVGGANAVVIGIAVVVIAIFINAIFSQVHWRIDLTDNQIYTLSPVSEQAVDELEEPIEVRAFISPNMPPPYHMLDRQVDELLMEYRAASDGMLDYRIISPQGDEELEELASGYGIEPVTIGQRTDTESSYRAVYKGIAFVQGDRVEVITNLQSSGRPELDSYEYEFSRALLNLVDPSPQRVALLAGAGGPGDDPRFVRSMQTYFEQLYGELIQVDAVEAGQEGGLSDDYAALVVLNIEGDLGEEALLAIDQFVQRGGNVGWFQSGGVVDEDSRRRAMEHNRNAPPNQQIGAMRSALQSDLIDFFGAMGLRFGSDAVIDREQAMAYGAVPTEQGMIPVSHPALFPISDMAHELAPMRHFSTLVIPLPATIDIDITAVPADADLYEVLRTDDSAVRLPAPPARVVHQELQHQFSGEEQGSHVIAAALEGELPAYFSDHAVAPQERQPSRVLIVGSGEFIGPYPEIGYDGQLSGLGLQFFVNSVEWLATDHELAGIRSKAMPPLVADIPPDARQSIQIINIILVPAFFLCIAIFMFARRVRRKRELQELVGE